VGSTGGVLRLHATLRHAERGGGEERELLDDREAVLPDRRRPSGEMCNVTGGSSPAGGPEPGAAEASGRAVL